MNTFNKAQLVTFIGEDLFFPSVSDAVQGCLRVLHCSCSGTMGIECPPEVGISNCIHQQYTQVSIFVPRVIAGLIGLINSVLVSKGYTVKSAQADHAHHTYHLLKGEEKLSDAEMNELGAHLQEVLCELFEQPQQVNVVSVPSAASSAHRLVVAPQVATADVDLATLEEALAAERLRIAAGELARERVQALEAAIAQRQQP